jgi:hypothetical protein
MTESDYELLQRRKARQQDGEPTEPDEPSQSDFKIIDIQSLDDPE